MSFTPAQHLYRANRYVEALSDWERQGSDGMKVSPYFRRKRVIDRVLTAILLIPALPIIGALVLLVRLTSRGPGIYCQTRTGKGGQTFAMYKLRTMVHDAESDMGAVWTQPNDPRVTRVGAVLRRLHLDELPQLWNVLKGDMSLIGPRPERPEFVKVLAERLPGYLYRLAVLPGVTGLAQINFGPDTDLESVQRKLAADREYIERAGVLVDLRVFLCTCLHLIGLRGDRGLRLVRLQREVHPGNTYASQPRRGSAWSPAGLATPASISQHGAGGHAVATGFAPAHLLGTRCPPQDPPPCNTDDAERGKLQ